MGEDQMLQNSDTSAGPTTPRAPRDAAAIVAIALLAETWPQTFVVYEVRRKPLKLGIHNDIMAALDGAMTLQELRTGLSYYTNNVGYLRASHEGAVRIDLNGNAAGTVSADEAQRAVDRLVIYNKLRQQRKAIKVTTSVPVETKTTAQPVPKRLSLADLKQAALLRRQHVDA
jgi:ProP effector